MAAAPARGTARRPLPCAVPGHHLQQTWPCPALGPWLWGWRVPTERLGLVRGDTAGAALPAVPIWAPRPLPGQRGLVQGLLPPFSLLPRDPCSPCPCPQVAAMGCHSFALLFDDIDPCMCQADRDVFPSLAQAQASVANEAYQELGQPSIFLFCPTGTACSSAAPAPHAWGPVLDRPGRPTAAGAGGTGARAC